MNKILKKVACIVAHPNDETLWAGGTIMRHPSWKCFIISVCRGNNADDATNFQKALRNLKSEGVMGNLIEGTEEHPLDEKEIKHAIIKLLPHQHFDMIISHNPSGEYTRNLIHEEVGKAVIKLWNSGKISADELWNFAYEDGFREYHPKAVNPASFYHVLSEQIWMKKHNIITETYGFKENTWEAQTTPREEAFWKTTNLYAAKKWLNQYELELI